MADAQRVRNALYPGEDAYFKANPNVSGMAAEDSRVILNPYSGLSDNERASVVRNEMARLLMRERGISPGYVVPDEQRQKFSGTPYEGNEQAMKETIAARLVSGDPSVSPANPDQYAFAQYLAKMLAEYR